MINAEMRNSTKIKRKVLLNMNIQCGFLIFLIWQKIIAKKIAFFVCVCPFWLLGESLVM